MNIDKNRGFTIVEVLISMLILSIGVMGLGILQLTSVQNTQSGKMRSQASILAFGIIDSMRANIPAVTGGSYRVALNAVTPAAQTCQGIAADCTTIQMANSDINVWRTALANSLPSGTGQVVTADLGDTTQVTVTIAWLDPITAANGSEQLSFTSELPK